MTSIDKKARLKDCIQDMCECETDCSDCWFYDPIDSNNDKYFCVLRDYEKRVPCKYSWHMDRAMISD